MPQNLTTLESVATFYEQVRLCRNCDLCTKDGHIQKAYDHCLALFHQQLPLPVVFVGEGPGFCEERTGEPLTGFFELIESRCGKCMKLGKCFKYFLHWSQDYKAAEVPCPYAPGDEPERLTDMATMFKNRMKAIPVDMLYGKDVNGAVLTETTAAGKKRNIEDPRTAGTLFDHMLASAQFIRTSAAQYWADKERMGLCEPANKLPNCGVINAVQCRSWELKEQKCSACDKAGSDCKVCKGTGTVGVKNNCPPTDAERVACGVHIYNFLHLTRPKVVVATGNVALASLIGLRTVKAADGTAVSTELLNTTMPSLESVLGKELTCTLVDDLGYELKVIPIKHAAAHMRLKKDRDAYRASVNQDLAILKRVYADYIGIG